MAHLRAALSRARPSLPAHELARLERQYESFRAARDPGVGNREDKGKGKKATLA